MDQNRCSFTKKTTDEGLENTERNKRLFERDEEEVSYITTVDSLTNS